MRNPIAMTALLTTLLAFVMPTLAAEHEQGKGDESVKVEVQKSDKEKNEPAPTEKAVTTSHSLQIGARTIAYKATAGTLIIRDDKGKPDASMFYVAYTADGEKIEPPAGHISIQRRPGIVKHLAAHGLVRAGAHFNGKSGSYGACAFRLVSNADSLLDKSPIWCSSMRSAPVIPRVAERKGRIRQARKNGEKSIRTSASGAPTRTSTPSAVSSALHHREQALEFAEVPVRRIVRHAALGRSRKMAGGQGHRLNGVVLLSSIMNYASRLPGQDNDYVGTSRPSRPSRGITTSSEQASDVEPFLTEVRGFARGDYAVALSKGQD